MINVAVINFKHLIKFLGKCIVVIFVLIVIFFIVKKVKVFFIDVSFFYNTKYIEETVPLFAYISNKDVEKESNLKKVLISELAIFSEIELIKEKNNEEVLVNEENIELENNNENSEKNGNNSENTNNENTLEDQNETNNINNYSEEILADISTTVIEENNKIDVYTNVSGTVKIKNESSYTLTEEMLSQNVNFENKNDIIIYHTHTCESYTPTEANNYVASGNYRTIDLNYSVARVGSELTGYLSNMGYNVIHNMTYHDYPAYTGSYTRSLETITELLSTTSNAELVIDLHRDAIGSMSNYAPSVQIGDEIGAQLMFVIGTDGGGLEHKDWIYNFKLAMKIQEKANEMYPGLFKPIILRNSRYNQHVAKRSLYNRSRCYRKYDRTVQYKYEILS